MAKTKVNKSELIREFFKAHPGASNGECILALGEQGYTVTAALINQAMKRSGGKKAGKARRGRKAKAKTAASPAAATRAPASKSSNLPLDRMLLAADFTKACGGIDSATEALQSLKRIAAKL
jgi:hypothetical protein